MDAGNVLFLNVVPDLRGGVLRDTAAHLFIAAAEILSLLQNPPGIPFQQRAKKGGNPRQVRLGLLQLMGVQIDILHALRRRQNIHVPIVHIAPVGGRRRGTGLIVQGLGGVIVIIHHHQPVQSCRHSQKAQHAKHQRRQSDPPVLGTVHTYPAINWFSQGDTPSGSG